MQVFLHVDTVILNASFLSCRHRLLNCKKSAKQSPLDFVHDTQPFATFVLKPTVNVVFLKSRPMERN